LKQNLNEKIKEATTLPSNTKIVKHIGLL